MNEYPIHILMIKLWEWEGVKETSAMSIAKFGPDQITCETHETACERIGELKTALNYLTPKNPLT